MNFESLNQVFPGIQEAMKAQAIAQDDVKKAIDDLDGGIYGNVAAQASDFAALHYSPARVPGTNWHVRIPTFGKGILQLAWTGYKAFEGKSDLGDTFSVASAVEQIKSAIQRLNVEAGETCAYLAIGKAAAGTGHSFATVEQITDALQHGGGWCNNKCKFHVGNGAMLSAQEVHNVLLTLKSRGHGVVQERSSDQWSAVF